MQTSTVVKTHPILKYVALGVSIALVVVACTITQKHAPGVSIHETFVEIYPGTKISSDDQKALDAVLKNFNITPEKGTILGIKLMASSQAVCAHFR